MKYKTQPKTLIAGFIAGTEPRLTRNPLRESDLSSRLGDGGSMPAMRVKGVWIVLLAVVLLLHSCTKKQDKVESLLSQMTLEEK